MKTHFDWQTEERDQQEEKELLVIVPPSRRKPGCVVLTLIIMLGVLSLFIWLVNDTQSKAVAGVQEDVLRAFELQQQAVDEDDMELFSAMLSSNDPDWKWDQMRLFSENLVDDRRDLGLIGVSTPINQGKFDLSPDLQVAELTFVRNYTFLKGSQENPEIELLHHQFFVLENGRWMRSPADAAFWGAWNKINGSYVELTYSERDSEFAKPLVEVIDSYVENLCKNVGTDNYFGEVFCEGGLSWQIKLGTDDQTLLDFFDATAVISSNFDFELPSPTLVGIPLNEKDLDFYLDFYSEPIFQKMEDALLSTVPIPDQYNYALCFTHASGERNLYRFDWRFRSWEPMMSKQTFQFLSALPDDSRILLVEDEYLTMSGGDSDPSFLETMTVRHEHTYSSNSQSLLGWVETVGPPFLLFMSFPSEATLPSYEALDVEACDKMICLPEELPGFPIPSTLSDASLFVNGSDIFLNTRDENSERLVGKGFSPFWVDSNTFGFVRFQRDIDTNITTQVVLSDLSGGKLQVLVDGHDLATDGRLPLSDVLYINEVIPNPVDANKLLIVATGVRAYSGNYFIFSLDISNRQNENIKNTLELEIARQGSIVGIPGLLSPTGFPMMLISPNGRWIAFIELNSQDRDTWTIFVHDLLTGVTEEIRKDVPALPGNLPLLDWSDDGQWLITADRDSLLLVAPGYEYQDSIEHDFDACSQIVWAD